MFQGCSKMNLRHPNHPPLSARGYVELWQASLTVAYASIVVGIASAGGTLPGS
jgi:hypothetical protein